MVPKDRGCSPQKSFSITNIHVKLKETDKREEHDAVTRYFTLLYGQKNPKALPNPSQRQLEMLITQSLLHQSSSLPLGILMSS